MFEISAEPIAAVRPTVQNSVGAAVIFEGIVRNRNDGFAVVALEYEAFAPLAIKEGERILQEARENFGLVDVSCIHRVGRLEIGDIAIRVVATGVHRAEAFRGCEYVVDEVKARVPIWKKEHYVDREAGWVNCHRVDDDGV